MEFAREVLAHIAQTRTERPDLWQRALAALRRFLARLFQGTPLEARFAEAPHAVLGRMLDATIAIGARANETERLALARGSGMETIRQTRSALPPARGAHGMTSPGTEAPAYMASERTLKSMGNDLPTDADAPRLMPTDGHMRKIVENANLEFTAMPSSIRAADGMNVLIHNPDSGALPPLANRVMHLITFGDRRTLDTTKAAWLPMVPSTLQDAAVILQDTENGSRIYVRKYADGTRHMVVVSSGGVVSDQGKFDAGLITQFPAVGEGRRNRMPIVWERMNAPLGSQTSGGVATDGSTVSGPRHRNLPYGSVPDGYVNGTNKEKPPCAPLRYSRGRRTHSFDAQYRADAPDRQGSPLP